MKAFKPLLALVAVAALLLATAAPADASFRLRIEDTTSGVGVVVTDGSANDLNPLPDAVMYSGPVGAFVLSFQVGIATPGIPMAGLYAGIDLNTVVATTNPFGGTLRLILEKNGFTEGPDGFVTLVGSVGGVISAPAGSTVTFQSWVNPSNLMPTLGPDVGPAPAPLAPIPDLPPAGSVAAFSGTGYTVGPRGAFSNSQTAIFSKAGSYALFSSATITLTGPGSLSFDHTTGAAPAPAGLLLLVAGAPCLALGYLRRKYASARV